MKGLGVELLTPEPYTADTIEGIEEKAREKGFVVRYPAENELFIDIDTSEQYVRFVTNMAILLTVEPATYVRTRSPSGGLWRFHIVVTLERHVRDAEERLFLQALLGSDLKREILGYRQLRRGGDVRRVSCFFEKPPEVEA